MNSPVSHASGRVAAYLRLLERCTAPKALIDDFLKLIEIDNGIASEPEGNLETLDRLLLQVCRRFDFAAPFDQPDRKAFFRPYSLSNILDTYASDTPFGDRDFDPKAEQAYRRGFDQGFNEACRIIGPGRAANLQSRQNAIHKWRLSSVIFGPSPPGEIEPFGIKVSIRSPLPSKLRWEVFQRDGRRCVVCGASAAEGDRLHVDHIISVYNGGGNEIENLQTLCEPCNLGKGSD